MQPRSPLLDTYRELVARVLLHVGGALDHDHDLESRDPSRRALRDAASTWAPVPQLLDTIDSTVRQMGDDLFTVHTDASLSDQGKADRAQRIVTSSRTTIDTTSRQVLTRGHQVLDTLRAAGYPPRPAGDVTAQEAVLAGLKSDLRMVLDVLTDGDAVRAAMAGRLRVALSERDQLTTWLLGSSRWPQDYLTSRGASHPEIALLATWDDLVAEILTADGDRGLVAVRRTYRDVSTARAGIPVLDVLFSVTMPQILDGLEAWRLTSPSERPAV